MLEGTLLESSLRAAGDLVVVQQDVSDGMPLKTEEFRLSVLGSFTADCVHSEILEYVDEGFMEGVVESCLLFCHTAFARSRIGIRQFVVMQDRSTPGGPSDTRTVEASGVLLAVRVVLEVAERKRWRFPLIKPQC